MSEAKEEKKRINKKIVGAVLLAAVVIIAVVAGLFFFNKYQKERDLAKNPEKAKADEAAALVAVVGKLVKLPSETPAVATVSDVSKLSGQTLFRNAQNGDKVLIFGQAKKAVVYRPSTNQVIDIGNIVISPNGNATSASTSTAPAQKVRVVIYNGTKTPGFAKTIGSSLASKFTNIELGEAANASNDYQKTIIVDLSGKNKSFANSLAQELQGTTGNLPSGEEKPTDADILIILGQ